MFPPRSILVIFLASSSHATFQQGSKTQGVASTPSGQIHDIEVDSRIVHQSLSESMQNTLDLIKNVESLPSCAKIASSALLHSCSALEGSINHEEAKLSRGSDLFVEEEADIYSARLAVCELAGADFSIPKACQAFIPTEQTKKKRSIRGFWSKNGPTQPTNVYDYYDKVTLSHLQQCLKALGSTSQSWTSYSNNRQNAVVMCRAMQSQVERDEQAQMAKVLTSAIVSTTESVQDVYDTAKLLKEQFSQVAVAMPQFQMDLAAGNAKQLEYVQQFWAEMERAHNLLRDVLQDSDLIKAGLTESKNEVTELASILRKVATGSQQIATMNEANEFRLEQFQQDMAKALYLVTQDVGVINAFIPTLNREMATFFEASQSMHLETLNKQKENQAYLNQTADLLEQFSQAASDMNATMASISGFMGIGWPRAMDLAHTTGTFMGYTFVYTLFSYGLWEKYGGFYMIGTALASTATGTVLGFMSTFYLSPVEFTCSTYNKLSEIIVDNQLVLGIALGCLSTAIAGAVAMALCHMKGRKKIVHNRKYDPASPPYSPMHL